MLRMDGCEEEVLMCVCPFDVGVCGDIVVRGNQWIWSILGC